MLDTPVGSADSIFQIRVNGYSDGGSLYLQCESKGSGMQPVYGWSGVLGLQAPVLHSTGLRKACTVTTPKAELFQGAFNKFMAGSCRFAKQSLTNSDWITGPGVDRSEIKQEIEDLLQLGVVMCKSAPQGFPRDKARALMDAHLKLKVHCTGKLKLDKSEHIVQTTKKVRIHFHTFKDSITSMENFRLKQTVQVTLEIAASKAKDAATMSHSPLAILIWAFAAKEAGSWTFKYATLEGIKPADSANSDVNGKVWEKMKTILCTSTALTPNEVEQLGLHLLTDTQAGDRVPELRQLHERALEKLKNHGHLIAGNMIDGLRDAKYQLVASDFLAQEREAFMRKQNETMESQRETSIQNSIAAGVAGVALNEAAKTLLKKVLAKNDPKIIDDEITRMQLIASINVGTDSKPVNVDSVAKQVSNSKNDRKSDGNALDSQPTMDDLCRDLKLSHGSEVISHKTFKRIRTDAKIPSQLPGIRPSRRRYTPAEIGSMIKAVRSIPRNDSGAISKRWEEIQNGMRMH